MKNAEFRNWLRVMDIDAQDLYQLFQIIDEDGSGEIDPTEFIDALYRMKNAESKTATKFVKHIVESLEKKQSDVNTKLDTLDDLTATIAKLQKTMEGGEIKSPRSPATGRRDRKAKTMPPSDSSSLMAKLAIEPSSEPRSPIGVDRKDWTTSFEAGLRD